MEKKVTKKPIKKRKTELLTVKKEISDDLEFLSRSSADDDYDKSKVKKIKKRRKLDMVERLCGLTDLLRSRVTHMLIPSFNVGLEAAENLDELQNFPILKFKAPRPIYVASRFPAATDICYNRTINYEHHKNLLLGGRSRYLSKYKKNKNVDKLEKEGIYSNNVFNFAERFNRDPDKYFNGFFDYYYTGGNLGILPSDSHSQNVVLHATGEHLNNLIVSKYEQDSKLVNLYKNTENDDENEIFELRACPSQNSEEPKFIMRHRNELKVLTLMRNKAEEDEEEHIIDELCCFQANVPFISFAYVPGQDNLFLTSNMRQRIRQYSLDEGGPRTLQLYNLSPDKEKQNYGNSWNILRPYNEHNFFYANDKQLLLMDLRTKVEEWLEVKCRYTHNVLPCDRISTLAVSQHEPLLYVGTYHHLHCLDIRKMRADLSDIASSLCCFTHQMAYPPTFIDTYRHEDREFVAISSAVAGEVRICELKCGEKYSSHCLPYQPPTLKEAYHHAKLTGRCLQVGADLPKRLKCCTTGLAFYKQTRQKSHKHSTDDDENNDSDVEDSRPVAHLLMSNSNGDIFAQHIFPRKDCQEVEEQRVNDKSDEIMHEFAEEICRKSAPILQYTDICNIIGLNRIFRCKNLNKPADCYEDIEKPIRRRLGRWQKSVASLKHYKDALAQDILAIWDVEAEHERSLVMSQLPQDMKKKPKAESLVNNWLNMGTIIPPSMTVIPSNSDETVENIQNQCQSQYMVDLPQSTQIIHDDIKIENTEDETNKNLIGKIINMDNICLNESFILSEKLKDSINLEIMTPQKDENIIIIKEPSDANKTLAIELSTTETLQNTTAQNTSKNPKTKRKIKKYVKGF